MGVFQDTCSAPSQHHTSWSTSPHHASTCGSPWAKSRCLGTSVKLKPMEANECTKSGTLFDCTFETSNWAQRWISSVLPCLHTADNQSTVTLNHCKSNTCIIMHVYLKLTARVYIYIYIHIYNDNNYLYFSANNIIKLHICMCECACDNAMYLKLAHMAYVICVKAMRWDNQTTNLVIQKELAALRVFAQHEVHPRHSIQLASKGKETVDHSTPQPTLVF